MIGLGLGLGLGVGGPPAPYTASAPSNVSGADAGGGSAQVSWTDATYAPNGYDWELWVSGGSPTEVGTTFPPSPQNAGSSIAPGTYFYKLRTAAYPGANASAWVQSSDFTIA